MNEKQLYLFLMDDTEDVPSVQDEIDKDERSCNVSISDLQYDFDIVDIPFIGCDFDTIYPSIYSIIPQETVAFSDLGIDYAIMCEIVCSSICHQINWDFLRSSVLEYTIKHPEWLVPCNLASIGADEVMNMIGHYYKPDCVNAEERASILRAIGSWATYHKNIQTVFLDSDNNLRSSREIQVSLLKCSAFSSDPERKKMNLLLQKLDNIYLLKGIERYAKPAIDYHLLRLYLRRGLLIARTKHANEFINNPSINRKEATIAIVRGHCSKILSQISQFSGLSIASVNLVEWHVARSVCSRECPDCQLKGPNSQWLRPMFNECPFRSTCLASKYSNQMLLNVKEPSYKGTSY